MCPACMTSIALIAAGGTSATRLAMLALTRFSARKRTRVRPGRPELKGMGRLCLFIDPEGRMLGLWKGNSDGKSS
jgi:hypothetical protein